ncbi:MAG: hypothetical protein LRZ85_09580 [Alphaproteobacteria bacterium]|nr:hypothetical protein [Alphaproteobacteria bacterium]MCD8520254.1 hypothetical protein [Alphaproteobacteria bacterium]MCD8570318.1 hypothetical protein [Alphaproteobacteria bacterium]
MDDIKQRLVQASDVCVKAFEKWSSDQKSSSVRETLQEAIHELRKVASRLEIELAISERDQNAAKPIPIPPHRAARGKGGNNDMGDDNIGNSASDDDGPAPQQKSSGGAMRRRLGSGSGPRKSGGGQD